MTTLTAILSKALAIWAAYPTARGYLVGFVAGAVIGAWLL